MSTPVIEGIYVAWGSYPVLLPGYNEAELQNAAIGYLTRLGWLVLRINQGAAVVPATKHSRRRYIQFAKWFAAGQEVAGKGIVDTVCLTPAGVTWAIDFKKPNGCAKPETLYKQLNAEQKAYLQHTAKRNGIAVVCNNIDALFSLIQSKGK